LTRPWLKPMIYHTQDEHVNQCGWSWNAMKPWIIDKITINFNKLQTNPWSNFWYISWMYISLYSFFNGLFLNIQ
jgi:hypothetical protein